MNISNLQHDAWSWIKMNPMVTGLAALLLLAVFWYFGGSIKQAVLDRKTDKAVEKLQRQSDDLQQKAREEISEANKASGAVAAEDDRRQTEIQPAIERAAGNREIARTAARKARQDYDNSLQNNRNDAGGDVRALHERNCADFRTLYPLDNFAGCAQ